MRVIFVLFAFVSFCTFAEIAEQEQIRKSIEVIGFGQVEIDKTATDFTFIIKQRGKSSVKLLQSIKQKSQVLQQFLTNNSKKIKISVMSSIALDIAASTQINSIEQVEFITRLPNKFPAKINTKPTPIQSDAIDSVFVATQQISISFVDIKFYPYFIDFLSKLSVSDIESVSMSNKHYQRYYQRALDNALSDAELKVKIIAEHLNIATDSVIAVQEIMPVHKGFLSLNDGVSNLSKSSKNVEQEVVKAQVKVVFAIKP